jgi:DNA-binding transcriptional LysR family regulator
MRSFSLAATSLGLTQPALSRQIASLEREIGARLFDRGARELQLTVEGQTFLTRSAGLMDLYLEILHPMEPHTITGQYTISTGGTVAAYILPSILQVIRSNFPSARFRVIEGDALETKEALIRGEADIGILSAPVKESGLETIPFMRDRIIPAISSPDPLASKKRVTVNDIRDHDFIFFHPASAIRIHADARIRGVRPRFRPNIVMELRSVEAVIRSIRSGAGIGFVSTLSVEKGISVLEIPELVAEREFVLCFRSTNHPRLAGLIGEIVAGVRQSRL